MLLPIYGKGAAKEAESEEKKLSTHRGTGAEGRAADHRRGSLASPSGNLEFVTTLSRARVSGGAPQRSRNITAPYDCAGEGQATYGVVSRSSDCVLGRSMMVPMDAVTSRVTVPTARVMLVTLRSPASPFNHRRGRGRGGPPFPAPGRRGGGSAPSGSVTRRRSRGLGRSQIGLRSRVV
jgi:hypothetical protein